jgi:hypothetical protein
MHNTTKTKSRQRSSLAMRPLAVACMLLCCSASTHVSAQPPAGDPQAQPRADLPVRKITLYRSGVASFERRGSVFGNANVPLRFRTEQINDILKSLVVIDRSGGTVAGVSYPSQEPLARRLSAFGVDLTDEPSMAAIVGRLRGAPITITLPDGTVSGTVLGGETRPEGFGHLQEAVMVPVVNLVTKDGVRSVRLADARSIRIDDAAIADELNRALAAISEQRSDRFKTVDIALRGDGDRDVVAAYVHESPVWKTSYRLVLPASRTAQEAPLLQGWAIVENTSDEDWSGIDLSLASGQPSAFRMDLYQPLFNTRPELPVPVPIALAPRVYEEGIALERDKRSERLSEMGTRRDSSARVAPGSPMAAPKAASSVALDMNNDGISAGFAGAVAAAATGMQTGDVFFYRVSQPVTIERQRSAMIPIINSLVTGRRVSIKSPEDSSTHPRAGVEVTNSSGLQLIAGPVAVYDGGVYAGDAAIADTGKGDVRLLSYGVDQDVVIQTTQDYRAAATSISISKGLVRIASTVRWTTSYEAKNKDEEAPRVILIEQPRYSGATLIEPAEPKETTPQRYRFEVRTEPGAAASLRVVQQQPGTEEIAVTNLTDAMLVSYTTQGARVSDRVRDAIAQVRTRESAVRGAQQRVSDIDTSLREIAEDQGRIRENLGTVGNTSELATRLLKKLNDQETRLETLAEQKKTAQEQLITAQTELQRFIDNLTVE